MFPIQDERGRFIAFGGRILIDPPKADASEEEKLAFKKQAKYINSTENIAYSKGRHLFGLYAAKKAAHTPTLKKSFNSRRLYGYNFSSSKRNN